MNAIPQEKAAEILSIGNEMVELGHWLIDLRNRSEKHGLLNVACILNDILGTLALEMVRMKNLVDEENKKEGSN